MLYCHREIINTKPKA